jgi:hypothetical protein
LGGCFRFFPHILFLSSELSWAVGLCEVIGHAISFPFRFFLVNGSLFICLFFCLFSVANVLAIGSRDFWLDFLASAAVFLSF